MKLLYLVLMVCWLLLLLETETTGMAGLTPDSRDGKFFINVCFSIDSYVY